MDTQRWLLLTLQVPPKPAKWRFVLWRWLTAWEPPIYTTSVLLVRVVTSALGDFCYETTVSSYSIGLCAVLGISALVLAIIEGIAAGVTSFASGVSYRRRCSKLLHRTDPHDTVRERSYV